MISGKTRLIGIFGWPVEHSRSPLFQNAAFEALGLDYCYVPLPVRPKDLGDAVRGFRAMNFAGANVTIPHKEQIIPFLDELAPSAVLTGAVNTIEVRDGKLIGHNTDGEGFVRSLNEAGIGVEGRRCLMIGAGGAAKGVAVALAKAGISRISIANRNPDRAVALSMLLEEHFPAVTSESIPLDDAEVGKAAADSDILIQTTSLGMKPDDPLPVPESSLRPGLTVCDLIYSPPSTLLIENASAAGAKTLGGLGMLLHQGAIAFEIWTGRNAPVAVMRNVLSA